MWNIEAYPLFFRNILKQLLFGIKLAQGLLFIRGRKNAGRFPSGGQPEKLCAGRETAPAKFGSRKTNYVLGGTKMKKAVALLLTSALGLSLLAGCSRPTTNAGTTTPDSGSGGTASGLPSSPSTACCATAGSTRPFPRRCWGCCPPPP